MPQLGKNEEKQKFFLILIHFIFVFFVLLSFLHNEIKLFKQMEKKTQNRKM